MHPLTLEQLKEAYKRDKCFNSLPIRKWDLPAGFDTGLRGRSVNLWEVFLLSYAERNWELVLLLVHKACVF